MSLPKEETPIFRSSIYPPASLGFSSFPALSVLLQSFFDEQCRDELQGYIWQREAPRVTVVPSSEDDPAHLLVSIRHGGCIEDEWLAVHLLLLASVDKRFSECVLLETLEGQKAKYTPGNNEGLVIDAKDEDGQFLLIEGADHLPEWVQPDNADGRLWIYQGHFHLISPQVHPGDRTSAKNESQLDSSAVHPIHPSTAIQLVRSPAHNTSASSAFEDAILKQRLPSYPTFSWALVAQHSTLAYLSPKAARALHNYPQLLATAAEAFDGREGSKDSRCLRAMKIFGPSVMRSSDVGSVASDELLVKIKLPRRLYATLLSQRYIPPIGFGHDWRNAVSGYWEALEKASRGEIATADEEAQRDEGRRRDLGCKIASGLELACMNVKERLKNRPSDLFSSGKDSELRHSASYSPFIAALTRMGFFGNNIQDSREWKVKEKEALELLRKLKASPSELDDEHTSDSLQHLADLATEKSDTLPLPPHLPISLPRHALTLEEDPDGFLYEAPGQSTSAGGLKRQEGLDAAVEDGETQEEKAAMEQVNAFADKLQGFVDGRGDETGALFEDEEMDSDAESDDEGDKTANKGFEDLSHEEKARAMKGLVPELPMEEWGARVSQPPKEQKTDAMSVDDDTGELEGESAPSNLQGTTGFSRRVRYDGASDSEESVDDEILRAGDTEEDRQSRAKWLDIEREVEEDERSRKTAKEDLDAFDMADDEEGEDVHFGQDELMSFIEFTRKELGLSTEQYEDILRKRRERGAYVPGLANTGEKSSSSSFAASKKVTFEEVNEAQPLLDEDLLDGMEQKTGRQIQAERREEHAKSLRNQRTTAEEKKSARNKAQKAVEEVEAGANRRPLSTQFQDEHEEEQKEPFEKLMRAMDEELAKHKSQKSGDTTTSGEGVSMSVDDEMDSEEEDDNMSAEDAELLEKMLHNGPPASLRALMEKDNRSNGAEGLSSVEQEVMQSMLASYQAQMGGAGPVGALAGRLGVGSLPRNSDQ